MESRASSVNVYVSMTQQNIKREDPRSPPVSGLASIWNPIARDAYTRQPSKTQALTQTPLSHVSLK